MKGLAIGFGTSLISTDHVQTERRISAERCADRCGQVQFETVPSDQEMLLSAARRLLHAGTERY
jgi:hypothetical protein